MIEFLNGLMVSLFSDKNLIQNENQ